jgi:hypothetical protein
VPENTDEIKVRFLYNSMLYELTNMIGETIGTAKRIFAEDLQMPLDMKTYVFTMIVRESMGPYIKSSCTAVVRQKIPNGIRLLQCRQLEVTDEYVLDENDLRVEFHPKDEQNA